MTRGFYEQIGVPFDADLDQIRAAYGRAVAQLLRRREATVTQGGDPSALELARAQLDEAWEVLSDPPRRRRYDAMLAVAADGWPSADPDALWNRVAGSMIHPSVSASARLVDATTRLRLGPLPEAPRAVGARAPAPGWEEDATVTARVQAVMRDGFGPRRAARAAEATLPEARPWSEPPRPPEPARPSVAHEAPRVHEAPREPARQEAARSGGEAWPAQPARAEAPRAPAPAPPRASVQAAPPPHTARPEARPEAQPARVAVPQVVADPGRIPQTEIPSGAMLRAARERKGMTLQQVSDTTRISVRYLAALESEDFAALPSAAAFVRGYVREVARLLDLDSERVVQGYMRRFSGDA